MIAASAQITFVVVSKSHGTRLFPSPGDPSSSDGRTGNVVPGTVVDTIITAPLKYEFFLNSHAGIQVGAEQVAVVSHVYIHTLLTLPLPPPYPVTPPVPPPYRSATTSRFTVVHPFVAAADYQTSTVQWES